jgi:hypothetical protein
LLLPDMATQGQTMAIDAAPWTVKGLRKDIREAITRQSRMAGISVAEWITLATQNQISREAGNKVIPPGKPEQTRASSGLDLADVAAALQAMAAAQVAGLPVSKAAVRGVVSLIRDDVRIARGLPDRQTPPRIGQTLEAGSESGRPDTLTDDDTENA